MSDFETRYSGAYDSRAATILDSEVERVDFVKVLDALVGELSKRGNETGAEAAADLASALDEIHESMMRGQRTYGAMRSGKSGDSDREG